MEVTVMKALDDFRKAHDRYIEAADACEVAQRRAQQTKTALRDAEIERQNALDILARAAAPKVPAFVGTWMAKPEFQPNRIMREGDEPKNP
jgi:hypothetical protein